MINTDGKTNNKCKQGANRDLNPRKADPLTILQNFQANFANNEEIVVVPRSSSCTNLTMKLFFPANHGSYLWYFYDSSIEQEQSSNSSIYRLHASDFEQNTLINGMTLFSPIIR